MGALSPNELPDGPRAPAVQHLGHTGFRGGEREGRAAWCPQPHVHRRVWSPVPICAAGPCEHPQHRPHSTEHPHGCRAGSAPSLFPGHSSAPGLPCVPFEEMENPIICSFFSQREISEHSAAAECGLPPAASTPTHTGRAPGRCRHIHTASHPVGSPLHPNPCAPPASQSMHPQVYPNPCVPTASNLCVPPSHPNPLSPVHPNPCQEEAVLCYLLLAMGSNKPPAVGYKGWGLRKAE